MVMGRHQDHLPGARAHIYMRRNPRSSAWRAALSIAPHTRTARVDPGGCVRLPLRMLARVRVFWGTPRIFVPGNPAATGVTGDTCTYRMRIPALDPRPSLSWGGTTTVAYDPDMLGPPVAQTRVSSLRDCVSVTGDSAVAKLPRGSGGVTYLGCGHFAGGPRGCRDFTAESQRHEGGGGEWNGGQTHDNPSLCRLASSSGDVCHCTWTPLHASLDAYPGGSDRYVALCSAPAAHIDRWPFIVHTFILATTQAAASGSPGLAWIGAPGVGWRLAVPSEWP